jgi:hypothetical protein
MVILGLACALAMPFAFLARPLFAALVWSQPQVLVHRWTVVLAAVPLWSTLSYPLHVAIAWIARWIDRDDELVVPADLGGQSGLPRVSLKTLARSEADGGIGLRLVSSMLAMVPLAAAYFHWL